MWKHYTSLPRPIYILCLGTLINRAGSLVVPFLAIYLNRELNMGGEFATRVMGGYGLGALAASLIGGHLADLLGRKVVMVGSLLGAAVALLVLGALESGWAIMTACVLFALVAEMYRPAASAMIADLVESDARQYSFSLMYVSVNLGFSVAAFVGGMIAHYSFQWLFWGDALTAFVYAVIVMVFIAETLPKRGPISEKGTTRFESGATGMEQPRAVSIPEAVRRILGDATFVVFCLGLLCLALVYMQSMSTLPLYLMKRGIDEKTYGQIIAINGILIVLLQLPVTSIVGRFHRGNVLVVAAVVTAIGFGAIGLATSVWQFMLTVVVWTIAEMMHAPLVSTVVTDLAPTELRARYLGIASTCFSGAMMIGAPLGGMVLERLGGRQVWVASSAVAMLSALLFLAVRQRIAIKPHAVSQDHM